MDVAVGQLWMDNDPRLEVARLVHVTGLQGDRAICETWYDRPGECAKTVFIKVARFKPTSNGYRLATAEERARADLQ